MIIEQFNEMRIDHMKIETKYHGEVDITTDDIWTFAKGIPGFPKEKQFAVLPFYFSLIMILTLKRQQSNNY